MNSIKLALALLLAPLFFQMANGQETGQMVRLAKLVIDSTQLEAYQVILKEEIATSVKLEPGVLTLYAVAEKANPNHITILEIYSGIEAYEKHIQTPHFLKYKDGTKHMVKSLELIATIPLIPEMKIK
ncbi:MAG TPA: antibiotic biosynthesis monooxygenase [Saprospiraceae bacterium]|nr:antibiotic biosynthesis monooxygenase [Saprospiraceae bacterium]HNT20853.1 antibiotic biosynthesis monooxygenase [Saprospiraceae bacterium]